MNRRAFLATTITGLALASAAAANAPKVYANGGIAVDGTDVVAYFAQNAPVAGTPEFTHEWNGATWRFVSAANKDAFAADPMAYAPQYGGHCAWAVSQGYTASTVPDAWRIEDGKLYLNYSRRVQRSWEKDMPVNIQKANANWPKLEN